MDDFVREEVLKVMRGGRRSKTEYRDGRAGRQTEESGRAGRQTEESGRRRRKRGQRGGENGYEATVQAANSLAKAFQEMAAPFSNPPGGSTSGSMSALFDDIIGLVDNAIMTVSDTVTFADQVIALPSNLGTAYNQPLAQQKFTF